VLHLLSKTLSLYQDEMCVGCRINHPSQRRHQCLNVGLEGFYQENFYWLMKRLYTPKLIPAIQHFLSVQNIKADQARIRNKVEGLLHELKSKSFIYHALDEMLDREDGDSRTKKEQLDKLCDLWLER